MGLYEDTGIFQYPEKIKHSINIKIHYPIRPGHKSVSIYHACPYCYNEDWGSVMISEENRIIECYECGKEYILTKAEVKHGT